MRNVEPINLLADGNILINGYYNYMYYETMTIKDTNNQLDLKK